MEVVYKKQAFHELNEAVQWYNERRAGLGWELKSCVDEAIDKMGENPYLRPIIFLDVRQILIRRFPYFIIYSIRNNKILILGIFHKRRNRKDLLNR